MISKWGCCGVVDLDVSLVPQVQVESGQTQVLRVPDTQIARHSLAG